MGLPMALATVRTGKPCSFGYKCHAGNPHDPAIPFIAPGYYGLANRRGAELGVLHAPHYAVLDMNMKPLWFTRRMLQQITTKEFGDYRPVWHDYGVVLFVRDNRIHPGTHAETDSTQARTVREAAHPFSCRDLP